MTGNLATRTVTTDPHSSGAGRNELGAVTIADRVVAKVAARAAADHPDVGAPATRLLGVSVPGRGTSSGSAGPAGLPSVSVDVDGSRAFVTLTLSVRWPASVRSTTEDVRRRVQDRVGQLTGLSVDEVDITVADLVTDIAAPARVH